MLTNQSTGETPAYRVLFSNDIAEVRLYSETGQHALCAIQAYKPGDVITTFRPGAILHHPTYLTVQTGMEEHITLQPDFLQYVNHSCRPNVFFDTTHMHLMALRPLEPGEEFTFFYPSTEWDMAQPFQCYCGHDCCLGEIKGAAWLSDQNILQYRFTDFIKQQLEKRQKAARA